MPITVSLSPLLRKYVPNYDHATGIRLRINAPSSVDQIVERLNIPQEEVVSIMINGYPGKLKTIVKEGDSVTLARIIGGG